MILEISGKKVGIKFNNAAIENLQNVKHSDKGYYAYVGWCVWKQVDEELEYGDIADWVDRSVNEPEIAEQVNQIYLLYTQCEAYKKLQKKKSTKRGTPARRGRKRAISLEEVHAFAWGEIGLTPYQYYCLTPYEFFCICKGYEKKQLKISAALRKHAQIVYACAGGKEDITSFWPIPELDKEVKPKRPAKKTIRNIFADARRRELERRLIQNQN